MRNYTRLFLLLTFGIFFSGTAHSKTVGTRVDNKVQIAGFDNYIWQDGYYPSPTYVRGGAISNEYNGKIGYITNSDFINNLSTPYGGAMENYGKIDNMINLYFGGNSSTRNGGAIANTIGNSKITLLKNSRFISNSASGDGGAILNGGTIENIDNTLFLENSVKNGNGGAIANLNNANLTITNSSFVNNISPNGNGGAIANLTNSRININVNGTDIIFDGNQDSSGQNDYYAEVGTTNNFNIIGGSLSFGGSVRGQEGWSLNIASDNSGTINFNHNLENADMTASGVTMNTYAQNLINNRFDVTSSSLNINDMGINGAAFRSLKMTDSDINLQGIDVNLNTKNMGRLSADEPIDINGGLVNITELNIVADTEEKSTDIEFADMNWADKVRYKAQKVLAPIFEYDASYNPDNGNFNFKRTEKINTSVHVSKVATLANSILIEEIYSKVLNDMDREFSKNNSGANKLSDRTWVRAFDTNDDVSLKNFGIVDTEFDGILAGINSEKIYLGNYWDVVGSIYGAYVRGKQNYDTSKITQSGEYIGASLYAYRGQFFARLTANVGFMTNKSSTMYGKDKYDTTLGGFAFKSGLDIPVFKNTTIQPNLFFSYTYIDTENYINPASVHIHSDALDIIEISPGLRLLQKISDSSDVYFDVRYVKSYEYNGEVRASNIILPDISLKSFFEYGLGIQKNWSDTSSPHPIDSFIQITRRDGGREGWSGLLGVKFSF